MHHMYFHRRMCGFAGTLCIVLAACSSSVPAGIDDQSDATHSGSGMMQTSVGDTHSVATEWYASEKPFISTGTSTLTGSSFVDGDCHAADLTVSTQTSSANDIVSGMLIFINQSVTCTVHGFPIVSLASLSGHPIQTLQSSPPAPTSILSLAPKATVRVPFMWTNWCMGGSARDVLLMIRFAGQTGYLLVPLQTSLGQFLTQVPRCAHEGSGAMITIEPFIL